MPGKTILEIPTEEQARMLGELRQARYGYLLGLHILLLSASGRTPSEIASFLFRSRSSVYRTTAAYRNGKMGHRWGAAADASEPPVLRRRASLFARAVEAHARGFRLVPHAVESRHARAAIGGYSWLHDVARDHPAHAARLGLPLEAGAARGA